MPWGKVLLALLVLAAAHAGGFLLLTAEWRREKRGIEEARGTTLETAVQPTPPTGSEPAGFRAYEKSEALWKDRVRRDQLAARTSMFATGFAGAYLVELVLLGLGLARVLGGRGKGVRRPGPSSAPER